jgi:hypothetical protein
MNKSTGLIFAAFIIIVALVGVFLFVGKPATPGTSSGTITSFDECVKAGYPIKESYPAQCMTPDGKNFVQDIGNAQEKANLIVLDSPRPNETVTSPLTLHGKARGTWFFEASFPVQVLDAHNNVLAAGAAQAEGDWMTEAFVPFTIQLTFSQPSDKTGKLLLKKDNPSGLPEHDDELVVPIVFGENPNPAPSTSMNVKVYFGNAERDPEITCKNVFPVERQIPITTGVARAALEELLKGPTSKEHDANYSTSINQGVTIKSLTIQNGIAKVDFSEELQKGVAGSCLVTMIRAQITETLKQFSTVNDVVISVNGKSEGVLQP